MKTKVGKVIVEAQGTRKQPCLGVVSYLTEVARQYGDIRLEYQYLDDWAMHAPPGYLWKANCHSPRVISRVSDARRIVSDGLVRKSAVAIWKKRFQALLLLPTKVRCLRRYEIQVGQGGIYPDAVVTFLAPTGYVWRKTGRSGWFEAGFEVGDEEKAMALLRGGVQKL